MPPSNNNVQFKPIYAQKSCPYFRKHAEAKWVKMLFQINKYLVSISQRGKYYVDGI